MYRHFSVAFILSPIKIGIRLWLPRFFKGRLWGRLWASSVCSALASKVGKIAENLISETYCERCKKYLLCFAKITVNCGKRLLNNLQSEYFKSTDDVWKIPVGRKKTIVSHTCWFLLRGAPLLHIVSLFKKTLEEVVNRSRFFHWLDTNGEAASTCKYECL